MEILGNVREYTLKDEVLLAQTDTHVIEFSCSSASAFRIRAYRKGSEAEEALYALQSPPRRLPIKMREEAEGHFGQHKHLLLRNERSQVQLSLYPLRFAFFDGEGRLLSEDDAGLGMVWVGEEATVYRRLQPGERFFGLGEKTGPLDKAGKQYRNWNTDAFGYHRSTDPLYASCPFFMGLSHERPYGIFLNNSWETTFNFGAGNDRFSFFRAAGGLLDYFFFTGPQPADILFDYTRLTGCMPMPPLWSLGFQQCRYSYYPDSEVLRVAKTFRELSIPADVIYLDIHYMEDFKVFTWSEAHFPKAAELIAELRHLGFHVVLILDPGIKVQKGYSVYDSGMDQEVFAAYPDGGLYRGEAWPGWCHFPDFTRTEVRTWWGKFVKELVDIGVEGLWNDMNEPAVWGHHSPDIIQFGLEGRGGSHKEAHNVYGMQMARATAQGARDAMQPARPFILTRATFAGGQRDSALWTGDNFANDEHMLMGARMVSAMGLSGFPFSGNDVGGFTGDASAALFMRWIAYSAFHPLMRAHSMINSKHAEPWSFGEEATEVSRNYIALRYQLLPHFYSLFYESTQNGMPPVRSLIFRFHAEWRVFDAAYENQFMLGQHLLVCPVEAECKVAKVYLPSGEWYQFFNDKEYTGGQEHLIELQRDIIPVFVQAGAILPCQSAVQHSSEQGDSILHLHVYLGGEGHYLYYEDSGDGPVDGYEKEMSLSKDAFRLSQARGNFDSRFHTVRVYLHGYQGDEISHNGDVHKIQREDFAYLKPISKFDPYETYPEGEKIISELAFVEFPWDAGELTFKFTDLTNF